jgi:hypothetical protein
VRPSVTCAMDNRRADSPYDRQTVLSLSIVVWYLGGTLNCLIPSHSQTTQPSDCLSF